MNKFIPCRTCSKLPGPAPGYFYEFKNGFQFIKECDCHKKWVKEANISIKLNSSNITSDFTFADYKGTKSLEDLQALKYVSENFEKFKDKKMIYLWGKNGCQKTSMAQVLGKNLIQKGYKVFFTSMNTLMNAIVQDFDNQNIEEKNTFLKKSNEADLLIIDESFDSEKVTIFKSGYQIPYLDNFIRNRFEINRKSIMFISNKLPSEIEKEGFGYSLQNLIERNTNHSFLKFEDEFFKNAGLPDCKGLFK